MAAGANPGGVERAPRDGSTRIVELLKRAAHNAWTLLFHGVQSLSAHNGTTLAAGMSYYALLSVFPTAIVLAAGAGFILDDPGARTDAVNYLFDNLPLSGGRGRSDIEGLVDGVINNSGTLGLIGLIGLLISASALMGAIRSSINAVFGGSLRRGAIRGKALDVALVLGLGILIALSFAATLLGNLDITLAGRVGDAIGTALTATGFLLPLALSALAFFVLYTRLPVSHPPLRDVWPGVVFATVGYEVIKRGFSIYLDHFANYSAVYGSLGAVIAFMFFVYLASVVFLLGAEIAVLWPRVRSGALGGPDGSGPPVPLAERLRGLLAGLVGHSRVDE